MTNMIALIAHILRKSNFATKSRARALHAEVFGRKESSSGKFRDHSPNGSNAEDKFLSGVVSGVQHF